MARLWTILTAVVVVCSLMVMTTKSAYAYIDPGAGSYFLQMLAAGILAGLFVLRTFWQRIKRAVTCMVPTRHKEE